MNSHTTTTDFPALARTLGDTLAEILSHPSCPSPVRDAIHQFTDSIQNDPQVDGAVIDAAVCRSILPAVLTSMSHQ